MERSFWDERWAAGQIGFHLSDVNPHLPRHGHRLGPPGRLLVPLCGKSVDLVWLAEQGHDVWGVEFVPAAVDAFFAERGVVPEAFTIGPWPARRHGRVTLVTADVFALDPAALGTFDALWDRAALIALEPPRRREYVQRLRALARDDARLLLVTLEHDLGSGPPFSVDEAELPALYAGAFSLERLDDRDVLEAEPRFRERGATRMREQVWAGRAVSAP